MQELNRQVEVDKKEPRQVAAPRLHRPSQLDQLHRRARLRLGQIGIFRNRRHKLDLIHPHALPTQPNRYSIARDVREGTGKMQVIARVPLTFEKEKEPPYSSGP